MKFRFSRFKFFLQIFSDLGEGARLALSSLPSLDEHRGDVLHFFWPLLPFQMSLLLLFLVLLSLFLWFHSLSFHQILRLKSSPIVVCYLLDPWCTVENLFCRLRFSNPLCSGCSIYSFSRTTRIESRNLVVWTLGGRVRLRVSSALGTITKFRRSFARDFLLMTQVIFHFFLILFLDKDPVL